MDPGSVLVGLAVAFGVFAIGCGLIWLLFRGVEHEIATGRESRLVNFCSLAFFFCVNAVIHGGDEDRWYVAFYVVLALVFIALSLREWRRERA